MLPSSNPQASPSNPNGSTGPRTAEGKAICARNAVKHQIYSPTITLSTPAEQEEFETVKRGYKEAYKPITQAEHDIVLALTIASFKNIRLERASLEAESLLADRIREKLVKEGKDPGDRFEGRLLEAQAADPAFQDYMRRSRHLNQIINKRIRELLRLQAERRKLATLAMQAELQAELKAPSVGSESTGPDESDFASFEAGLMNEFAAFQHALSLIPGLTGDSVSASGFEPPTPKSAASAG